MKKYRDENFKEQIYWSLFQDYAEIHDSIKAYPLTLELLCISFIVPEFDFQNTFRSFILKEHTLFNHICVLCALIFQNSRPVIENSVDPDHLVSGEAS